MLALLALAVVGGFAYLLLEGDENGESVREIWLVNGARYVVSVRLQGPGFDVSMFPGFCQFDQPMAQQVNGLYEVTFHANWCAANTLWLVPDNVQIAQV
jgi:hypothetical protein